MSEILIAGIKLIAPKILEKVSNSLNPTDLEKAITKSVAVANNQEGKQSPHDRLFFRAEPHLIPYFLEDYFSHPDVIEELRRTLTNKELVKVDILTSVFIFGSIAVSGRLLYSSCRG